MVILKQITLQLMLILISINVYAQDMDDRNKFLSNLDSIKTGVYPLNNVNNKLLLVTQASVVNESEYLASFFEEQGLYGSASWSRLQKAILQGNVDSIYFYGNQTIELFQKYEQEDSYSVVMIQDNLIYWYISNRYFELAIYQANAMKRFIMENNLETFYARVYMRLADIYMALDNPNETIKLAKTGLEAIALTIDKYGKIQGAWDVSAGLYTQLIQSNLKLENYDQCLYYCEKLNSWIDSLPQYYSSIDITLRQKMNSFNINIWMSILYSEQGNGYKAQQMLKNADTLLEQLKNPDFYGIDIKTLLTKRKQMYERYYTCIGEYKKSLSIIDEMLSETKDNSPTDYIQFLIQKANIIEKTKDYFSVAQLRKEVMVLGDSLNKADMKKQISSLWTIFEVDKAQQQKQEAQQQTQRMYIIGGGLSIILLLSLSIGVFLIINNKRLREKNRILFEQQKSDKTSSFSDNLMHMEAKTEVSLYDKIIDYLSMSDRYTDPDITRDTVAYSLGTNRQYITDAIQKNTNMTFPELVNNLRLEHAHRLLLLSNDKITIKEVYLESGFNNRTTFIRLFREKYGMTPSEFKTCAEYDRIKTLKSETLK